MMGYLTPTVGLGCRSGGYLLYGVAATASWILIMCSSLLSHTVSLRYQEIYLGERPFIDRKDNTDPEDTAESIQMLPWDSSAQGPDPEPINLSAHRRTRIHSLLAFLTVVTRFAGKLIAAANACWVVLSAIFEYTGVYDSCWCETDADVLGNHAWATLFATPETFQTVARGFWIWGVIFSYVVCFLAYVGFFLGCKRSDIDVYDG